MWSCQISKFFGYLERGREGASDIMHKMLETICEQNPGLKMCRFQPRERSALDFSESLGLGVGLKSILMFTLRLRGYGLGACLRIRISFCQPYD